MPAHHLPLLLESCGEKDYEPSSEFRRDESYDLLVMPVTNVRDLATVLGHFHAKQMCAPGPSADEVRDEQERRVW